MQRSTLAMTADSPVELDRTATVPLRLAVLRGGTSTERHVSMRTGEAFLSALTKIPRERVERVVDVEWTGDDRWIVDGRPLPLAGVIAELERLDACLLALHGGSGEDGTIQGLLEVAGVAYTGSGVEAAAVAMDKWATRLALVSAGLSVAPGRWFARGGYERDRDAVVRGILALGPSPWFLKPRRGGSSVATYRVDTRADLDAALARIFAASPQIVVEAAVAGVELACAVLGNSDPRDPTGGLRVLPPVEIRPQGDAFFDHDQKYADEGAAEWCPPRSIGVDVVRAVEDAALVAHATLGCAGVSRSDFIVRPDGTAVILEVNTLPGMTARSLTPLAARAVGIELGELLLELVRLARARR